MVKNLGLLIVIVFFMLGCDAQEGAINVLDNQVDLNKAPPVSVDVKALLDDHGEHVKLILMANGGQRVTGPVWLSSVNYRLYIPLSCENENYKVFNLKDVVEPQGDIAYWSSRDFQLEADADQFACGQAYTCYLVAPYYELVPGYGALLYGQCDVVQAAGDLSL